MEFHGIPSNFELTCRDRVTTWGGGRVRGSISVTVRSWVSVTVKVKIRVWGRVKIKDPDLVKKTR